MTYFGCNWMSRVEGGYTYTHSLTHPQTHSPQTGAKNKFFSQGCISIVCMHAYTPVLEGSAELVGIDGQLQTKVVGTRVYVREYFHHRVLTKHVASLREREREERNTQHKTNHVYRVMIDKINVEFKENI